MNELDFDAAVEATLNPQIKPQQARAGFASAMDADGDFEAEMRRVARSAGVPMETARNMPDEVRKQERLGSIDFDVLAQTSPATAALLADVEQAKLAHDDVENLSLIERTVRQFSGGGVEAVGMSLGGTGELLDVAQRGLARFAGALLPTPESGGAATVESLAGPLLGEGWRGTGGAVKGVARDVMVPAGQRTFYDDVVGGLGQLSGQIAMLPVTRGAGLFAQGADIMAERVATDDASQGMKDLAVLGGAAVTGVTEKYAIDKILGPLAVPIKIQMAAALARIGIAAGAEGGQETLENLGQDVLRQVLTNPNAEIRLGDALYEGGVGATVGAIARSVVEAALHVRTRGAQREQDVQRAEQDAALIQALEQVVPAAKLRERDADALQKLVADATEDGSDSFYINADVLLQSGIAEQLAQVSPAVAEQLQAAAETGGQVRIPIAEYAARVAGTELSAPLLDHLRTDPQRPSPAEARGFRESGAEEAMREDFDRAIAEQEQQDTFRQSAEVVRANFQTQLDTAARFMPEVNEAYSRLQGAWYATTAARMGLTPEQLFEIRPLRVQAEVVATGAPVLDQGEYAQTNQIDDMTGLPLNEDGTVTVYHHTSAENAEKIRRDGVLRSAGEPDLYFTTTAETDTGYGDTAIPVRVRPDRLQLDDEFPDGRQDFRVESPSRGRRLKFLPDGSAVLNQSARGTFNPQTNVITLLKGADLSTFLHESGHAFLEMQTVIAADIAKSGAQSEGERQIVADTNALLQWFGVRDLDTWMSMPLEERRSHHEKFARGFEKYLWEGKAPSIELQPLFSRFRAFLLDAYKTLLAIAKGDMGKALNVEITDEVRGVLDRMLATDEQIRLAEQGRSMMPMFESAEDAAGLGVMIADWSAYQAEGAAGTGQAQQELGARGLRDMAWIKNARGREVKRLQKEAAARRAEMQMEARREVMSQPVYRAWQFLTGKITADDKIEPAQRPKSDPDIVDPSIDSLFVAIAKLGGIQRDQIEGEWGLDKKERIPQTGFNKHVLRRTGGLSLDEMRTALTQFGYLSDEGGENWNPREFEEAFMSELGGSPVYSNAVDHSLLREGKPGEELNIDGLGAGRLDRAGLADIGLPQEIIDHLVNLKMTARDGLHPDIVADHLGFTSGDELTRSLAAAQSPREAIDALTDQKLLQRYGELATPAAIERAADAAIHNEARARFVTTELNALAQALGQRKILTAAAKEYAQKLIGRQKVGSLRPAQYASAGARAGKNAQDAIRSKDLQTAFAEKRNQVLNAELTKAAHEARDEVEANVRRWRTLANRSDKSLGKSYDVDLVNVVRAILGEYGIAEKRAKKAGEYLKAVESYDPEMYAVVKGSIDAAEANAKPLKELTVEEVRGLADEIDAILHLARRSRQMEIDGDLIDREEIQAELLDRLEEIGVPDRIPGEGQAVTPAEARLKKLQTFIASARRMESWVGQMDGSAPMGPFRRFVWSRIKDAADGYRADKAKYLKKFRALFDAIGPTLRPRVIAAPELGYTFGKDSGGSAANEILHAILHTGNDSNKRKLLLGRQWAVELPDGSLDTSRWDAFINRMAREGTLTKAHFDFAQSVWDLLEEMKPMAQKTHRDVFGRYFDEVTAAELSTPFGVYRGGYVPAMADPRVVQDAELRALADEDNASMAYAFPTTPKGFTKARVEYNRPLLLDLRSLAQHMDKVLLFSHMEMPVRDVQRVLSKDVGVALGRVDQAAIPSLITPWLNRAARQQVETPVAGSGGLMRFFSVMRSRAGAAAMFANVANAAQQITGFSLAAVKVKPSLLLSATAEYFKSPKELARIVAEASPYMAGRMENEVAAMNDAIKEILLNPSVIERAQRWTMHHAYFLQSAVDNVMSPIIWTAAYNQAIAQGQEPRDAIRLADSAVRETQGSTQPEDISRFESGNAFVRLFTQFAGYFNMQANLLGTQFVNVMREYGLRQGAGRGLYVFTFGFLAPAIVAEAIVQAFRGGPEDEDDDGYLDDWLAAVLGWGPLRNVTAMLPVVGQGVNALVNAANSKPYDDRLATSPAISMLESAARAPVSVMHAAMGEGSAQKAVRDVATLISMTVGVPASAAARPIGYLSGAADGRIEPTGPVDAARGVVTGFASPGSR